MHLPNKLRLYFEKYRKILVVYNICGISGRDIKHFGYYIKCLDSILNQKFKGFHLALSSCQSHNFVKKELLNRFRNRISYNFIHDRLPVNITFNHTVLKCVENFGEFDAYVYMDCGVDLEENYETLQKMYNLLGGEYAMVSGEVDNDMAMREWFRCDKIKEITDDHFVIPLGRALNLHLQMFSNEVFLKFNRRILPDIFERFGTESNFSFMCAALKKRWVFHKDILCHHDHFIDGASSGFPMQDSCRWNQTFSYPKTVAVIISEESTKLSGWGFEEWEGILMHNRDRFDENGFVKDDSLLNWINENIFHNKNTFDYSKINYSFKA